MNMKAKLFTIAAALSFLFFLSAAPTFAQLPTTCSNALLRGDYGFTVDGKIIPPGGSAFVAQQGVAIVHYNGAGQFDQVDFIMTNGSPAINPGTAVNANGFRTNESGIYTVNPDCTGSFTLYQHTKFDTKAATVTGMFVLAKGGKEIRQVVKSITVYLPLGAPGTSGCTVAPCAVNVPATILANGKKLEPLGDDSD
jgi:hypothetical protein